MDFKAGEIFAIDKPYRISSFGALAHVRYVLSRTLGYKVKIGHAGTLDPLATGVLILCTGKATKRIEEFQGQSKEYTAPRQHCSWEPLQQAMIGSMKSMQPFLQHILRGL